MSEVKSTSLSNSERLLHTKLMPPRLPSALVERDELLGRLDAGLAKKVILVSAPTGFGKTTLVRLWIASRDFSSAWLTLDEHDNDPVRFWTYVCSALRTVDPRLGKVTLSLLTSPQPPAFESLLTPLLNDLARLEKSCVLVLEDYHAIKSPEIDAGMAFLVQHLPETVHLVLITRADPDLPLGILRARDASPREIEREIQGMGLGLLNRFMVRWTFRNMLLKNAYSVEEMRSMVAQTPFGKCEIHVDGVGFQVLLRKEKS